jgi:hypothetical protein
MLPVWKGLCEANGKWRRLAFATGECISLAKWQMHSSLAKARLFHLPIRFSELANTPHSPQALKRNGKWLIHRP